MSILSIIILIVEVVDYVLKRMTVLLVFSFLMVCSAIHVGQIRTVIDWMFVVTIFSIPVLHVAVYAVSLALWRVSAS